MPLMSPILPFGSSSKGIMSAGNLHSSRSRRGGHFSCPSVSTLRIALKLFYGGSDKEMPMSKRSMTYYVVTRERGENWDARLSMRQQEQWDEHAAFMNALVDDGFVVLGGPVGDGGKILLIIDAESEQEIDARLADDPWTPLGLLRVAKVEHWEILLGASE